MCDLEFLPSWYTRLQRHRRIILLQTWVILAIAAALGLWLFLVQRNQHTAEAALVALGAQLQQTDHQLQELDHFETVRRTWRQQAEVLAKLGTHIEAGRLIAQLADALPSGVSLQNTEFVTEETAMPLTGAARAALADPVNPPMDRRLQVKIQGVAPTDDDLATLLTELNKVPFFDRVTPTYVRDLRKDGHILRQFELTFTINLNVPTGT